MPDENDKTTKRQAGLYSLAYIMVDGVKMEGAADIVVTRSTGGQTEVEVDMGVASERDEEQVFLAYAMFRRRLRDEVVKRAEVEQGAYPKCEGLGCHLSCPHSDMVRDDRTNDVFGRLWLRAAAHATPRVWVCSTCAQQLDDVDPVTGKSPRGLESDERGPLHYLPGGARCGPLDTKPADARLRKLRDECMAEAALVVRECRDLTEDDYPAVVEAWDDDDNVSNFMIDDEVTKDARKSQFDGTTKFYEASGTATVTPGPDDRVPGCYTEIIYGAAVREINHPPPPPSIVVGVDTPGGSWTAYEFWTQADLDAAFGAGSRMALGFSSALPKKPDDPPLRVTMYGDGRVQTKQGTPVKGVERRVEHDDKVDALAIALEYGFKKRTEEVMVDAMARLQSQSVDTMSPAELDRWTEQFYGLPRSEPSPAVGLATPTSEKFAELRKRVDDAVKGSATRSLAAAQTGFWGSWGSQPGEMTRHKLLAEGASLDDPKLPARKR